jgi:hypothetical protein
LDFTSADLTWSALDGFWSYKVPVDYVVTGNEAVVATNDETGTSAPRSVTIPGDHGGTPKESVKPPQVTAVKTDPHSPWAIVLSMTLKNPNADTVLVTGVRYDSVESSKQAFLPLSAGVDMRIAGGQERRFDFDVDHGFLLSYADKSPRPADFKFSYVVPNDRGVILPTVGKITVVPNTTNPKTIKVNHPVKKGWFQGVPPWPHDEDSWVDDPNPDYDPTRACMVTQLTYTNTYKKELGLFCTAFVSSAGVRRPAGTMPWVFSAPLNQLTLGPGATTPFEYWTDSPGIWRAIFVGEEDLGGKRPEQVLKADDLDGKFVIDVYETEKVRKD